MLLTAFFQMTPDISLETFLKQRHHQWEFQDPKLIDWRYPP